MNDVNNSKLESYAYRFFGVLLVGLLGVTAYNTTFKSDSSTSTNLNHEPNKNIKRLCDDATKLYGRNTPMMQLTVAQGILESNLAGKPSKLAREYNNLFGIKGSGTNGSVKMPTVEYIHGKRVVVQANFAHNKTVYDSIVQHEKLLQNPRYTKVRACSNLECAASAIKAAGYATDPAYSKLVVSTWKNYGKYCQ